MWKRSDEDEHDDRRALGTLIRLNEYDHSDEAGDTQFSQILSLSEEQGLAEKKILEWFKTYKKGVSKPVMTLGGYAGCGKTALLGVLASHLTNNYSVAFATLTGKAASVLERSLKANGVKPDFVGTCHRLLYSPVIDDATGEVTSWQLKPPASFDLIVIDEASMLSQDILNDLLALGLPILCVGDHGQLPPVGDDVGIMSNPDLTLVEVRRQAMDNPVIALSVMVRNNQDWRGFVKNSGDPRIQAISQFDLPSLVMDRFRGFRDRAMAKDPLVLCAKNETRVSLNKAARVGITDVLVEGDRIICLRNTYMKKMLLANGFRGRVSGFGYAPNPMQINAKVSFLDEGLELQNGMVCKAQFNNPKTFAKFTDVKEYFRSWHDVGLLFDYGNALTVHKAQGSQQDEVIIAVERLSGDNDQFNRWLYTGFTRASKSLIVSF
jgi:exodeoxyribonuclease-5